jgi:hypothetical protein
VWQSLLAAKGGGEVARVQRRAPLGRHTQWEAEEQHEECNERSCASAMNFSAPPT